MGTGCTGCAGAGALGLLAAHRRLCRALSCSLAPSPLNERSSSSSCLAARPLSSLHGTQHKAHSTEHMEDIRLGDYYGVRGVVFALLEQKLLQITDYRMDKGWLMIKEARTCDKCSRSVSCSESGEFRLQRPRIERMAAEQHSALQECVAKTALQCFPIDHPFWNPLRREAIAEGTCSLPACQTKHNITSINGMFQQLNLIKNLNYDFGADRYKVSRK